ncbi:MAG: ribosomal protein S19 family protein [Candidatus Micrarchaeales archaeon]|nr:ribosomal protein S19 family protein [Candidatus Micrarchaeales archaeon]
MVERIAFRGKTAQEAQALKPDEYMSLVKSRQRRTMKRQGLVYRELIQKVEMHKKKGITKPIRTHVREAVILPSWIGMRFDVHNGKEFQALEINASMLGHRLGEYAFSTKRVQHSAPGIKATKGSKFLAVK